MLNHSLSFFIAFLWAFILLSNSHGQEMSDEDYFNLSLQELADMSVISGISRKEQSNFQSTSASYVITQEAIRRSGMTSIPDLLRMVPGMHVSQLNGNMWAINTRSPNTRFSDELLVMIDGRSVYNTLFNGVYWSRVDTMLEDVERIEVIRGPGSSLWGSNASNGIVNVVTKTADKTQGLMFNVSAGSEQFDNEESLRFGFAGENHDSRIYAKQTRLVPGTYPPHDEQSRDIFDPGKTDYDGRDWSQAGFRSDLFLSPEQTLTVQGDYYKGHEDEMRIPEQKNKIDVTGHNVLARYQQELEGDSAVILQAYFDYTESDDDFFKDTKETYDIDFTHNFSLTRQEWLWGMSYRKVNDRTHHFGRFALSPENRNDETYSLFLQDEITLLEDSLFLTIGSKFEQNDYTDYESQPNIKLAYQYNDDTFFWGSLSKAVSIPSRTESDAYLDFNDLNNVCSFLPGSFVKDPDLGCIIPIGQDDLKANVLYAKELGYRQKFSNRVSIDNTIFMHDYRQQPGGTHQTDYLWGYEGIVNYKVNDDWALEASWTYHRGHDKKTDKKIDEVKIPRNSGFLSSYYTLKENIDIDLSYYYTGHINTRSRIQRVDLRLAYRPTKSIELSLVGTNLFDSKHTEGSAEATRANTNIERAVMGKISYQFQ